MKWLCWLVWHILPQCARPIRQDSGHNSARLQFNHRRLSIETIHREQHQIILIGKCEICFFAGFVQCAGGRMRYRMI